MSSYHCGEQPSPKWPGFYHVDGILYCFIDMWYYITVWTTLISTVCYIPPGLWAYFSLRKKEKYAFTLPILFTLYGMLISFILVSVTGKYK